MGRYILSLRRLREFVYGSFKDGVFPVQVFYYSGGPNVTRLFGEGFSIQDREVVPFDLCIPSHRGWRQRNENHRGVIVRADIGGEESN